MRALWTSAAEDLMTWAQVSVLSVPVYRCTSTQKKTWTLKMSTVKRLRIKMCWLISEVKHFIIRPSVECLCLIFLYIFYVICLCLFICFHYWLVPGGLNLWWWSSSWSVRWRPLQVRPWSYSRPRTVSCPAERLLEPAAARHHTADHTALQRHLWTHAKSVLLYLNIQTLFRKNVILQSYTDKKNNFYIHEYI